MSKQEFQVGDTVEVLESQKKHIDGEKYFKVGDRGVIVDYYDSDNCEVDFSGQSNDFVLDDGVWYVDYENIKLISRGEM